MGYTTFSDKPKYSQFDVQLIPGLHGGDPRLPVFWNRADHVPVTPTVPEEKKGEVEKTSPWVFVVTLW